MASGGGSPYECCICFNDMVDRNPKLLQCHHSFCLPCLQQVARNGKIACPTCRAETAVPQEGVQKLTSNFHLVQMYEEMMKRMKNVDISCQMCMKEQGVNQCKDCPGRMCEACTKKHSTLPHFQKHKVLPLCQNHDKGFTHICLKCVVPVCPTCILIQHEDHTTEVKEWQDGLLELRQKVDEWVKLANNGKKSLMKYKTELKDHIQSNEEIKQIIRKRYDKSVEKTEKLWEQYEQSAEETGKMKALLDDVSQTYEQNRTESCQWVDDTKAGYEQMIRLAGDIKGSADSIDLVKSFKSRMQQLAKCYTDLQNAVKIEYKVSPLAFTDSECAEAVRKKRGKKLNEQDYSGVVTMRTSDSIDKWLANPELLLNLTNKTNANFEFKHPRQIICAHDSVFIANNDPGQVLRVDKSGNIIRKYYPKDDRSLVHGCAICGKYLFIHTGTEITQMPIDQQPDDKQFTYKPDVQQIWKMLAVNSHKFIITDRKVDGNIYEYNPETKITKVCVKNIRYPSYISSVNTTDGLKYIVSLSSTAAEGCSLHVYNSSWKHIATIGSAGRAPGYLDFPQATVVTDTGKVLVAACKNHRVCIFDMNGTFLTSILDKRHGIQCPYGLAYDRPYLWVTQGFDGANAAVKCFQIAE